MTGKKKNPEGKGTSSHCHFYLDLNAEINTLPSKTGSTEQKMPPS